MYEVTQSFEQVFDVVDYHNLDEQYNTQTANAFCRLNRSWYIMDFRQTPPEVQALITQEVTEAAKVHQANKTPKAKAKRKAKGKGEVTKLQLRQFAKQFHEAKNAEFKSWQEENHVYEIVDM